MNRKARRAAATIVVAGAAAVGLAVVPSLAASASEGHGNAGSLPPAGAIKHVIVIDLENESFGSRSARTRRPPT